MTKEEIINEGHYSQNSDYSALELKLFVPFFRKEVRILALDLPSTESEAEINLITDTVNEILSLKPENKIWLKREIWNHYQSCISNISYADVATERFANEAEANKAYFQIFTEDEAYSKAELEQIWFDVSFLDSRYYNLEYKCPWETEHGIKIGVMNGEFDSIE